MPPKRFRAVTAKTLPVGVTMGDAAGIGPEIIVKMWADRLPEPAVVYGDSGVLDRTVQVLGQAGRLRVRTIEHPEQVSGAQGVLEVVSRRPPLPHELPPGRLSADAGRAAYDYVVQAIDDAQRGALRAIVTAPLNKKAMEAGGIDFPGHTEILAQRTNTRDYAMMLANSELRVILVTIHEPLGRVPALITQERELVTIRLAARACMMAGVSAPRVAVAGLNPHAGEQGRFGHEEIEIIAPAIAAARREGIDASGPYPGDTIFMRARKGEFDIVVAQYHDQGLIPVKYLGVDEGVNITVGLPFVRTSVDHGTAFDIAGKGIADPASLRAAFDAALSMSAAQALTCE